MSLSSIALRFSSLALLLGSVSACTTPSPALWSEADAHREIAIRHVQLTHDMTFAAGSAGLTAAEIKRLDDFVARQQVGYGDTVAVQVSGDDPRLDARRAAAVVERLARAGIGAERSAIPAPTGLRVVVSRAVAVPPACPDWRKPASDGDPSNTPMSNLGCANLRNFGLMIADPSELIAGRPSTSGQGEPLAAGVQRYRTGKIPPLPDSETTK